MNQAVSQDVKALIFTIGKEEYGVDISQIVSIERMQTITSYSDWPPPMLGVTYIREVMTPIVDLKRVLTGEWLQPTDAARTIIVQVNETTIGLVVEGAKNVLDIPPYTIQHANLLETKEVSYLLGISKLDHRLLIMLDIEKLLKETTNLHELKQLQNEL